MSAAITLVPEAPSSSQILDWITAEPRLAKEYALARDPRTTPLRSRTS